MNDPNIREAKRLIDQLIKISPNADLTRRAQRMRSRISLPMDLVIAKIPGETLIAKAKRIGVKRQTLYYWSTGKVRPGKRKARLLAQLTGYDYALIRGLADDGE